MATPLPKIISPYNRYRHEAFPFKYPIRTPITATKFSFPVLKRRQDKELTSIKGGVSSMNNGYVVSELEREKEKADDEEIIIGKEDMRKLADTWLEIHGLDNWEGMLDPLDPLLRSELIRYGEMAQACYDAFDSETFSKYCGSCKYRPTKFFECLGLMQHGYEVASYIHASCEINLPDLFQRSICPEAWSQTANWIGYVAVSNDKMSAHLGRRDITIAWRGTLTRLEWIEDFMYFLRPISLKKIPCPDPRVRVESGFLDLYTNKNKSCQLCKRSAREQILAEVKRLIQQYKDENLSITITGHSLGSALAILSAYDIAETGIDVMDSGKVVPTCVFSFSGPRVGNIRFKERLEELGVKILRVVNIHDKVPQAPGIFFNEHIPLALRKLGEMSLWLYSHVGVELALDHKDSPFLKETSDLGCFHNLEAHLHLLDGYHGKGQKFVLTSRRDIALVNKASDFLKKQFLIPPKWQQSENKGLARNQEGYWVQPERPNPRDHL
ncbi:phospholipase A1-Igamma2, chloroplastic-like [Mangifera indica]|uniref:phospholipase A1-Igamma2, chloroplastic-like n=1 Tax=Mangifera indica TaxID=29780 RepID=UPI001CFB1DD7|nr:phospholipase A1-Igamma2, chloroplastic-like [Mangifera indica]